MPDKLPPAEPSDEERHALTQETIAEFGPSRMNEAMGLQIPYTTENVSLEGEE